MNTLLLTQQGNATILITLILILPVLYIVLKLIKNKKNKKTFNKNLKVGNVCSFRTSKTSFNGKVIKITEDRVKVIFDLPKGMLYPERYYNPNTEICPKCHKSLIFVIFFYIGYLTEQFIDNVKRKNKK